MKVLKEFEDVETDAMRYGTQMHEAAEHYVRDRTPLPSEFEYVHSALDSLLSIKGDRLCEYKMGLTENLKPCGFFAPDVWWRGIADLLILNGDKAFIIDYKTSKNTNYADTRQLDLLAGATFIHYPEVKKVKSALSFVVCKGFITKDHTVDMYKSYMSVFDSELERIEVALEKDVWNPVESGLCGFCPVTSCEHNRR